MRIMYITFDDIHSNFAWSVHIREVAERLHKRGHSVLLVGPNIRDDSIKVFTKSIPVSSNKLVKVLQYFITSGYHFLSAIINFKPHIIYCRGVHFTLTPILSAIILGKPFIVEINGLLEDTLKNRLVRYIFISVQKVYLVLASRIITVSDLLKEGLCKRYNINSNKVYVIPNGADCEKFMPMNKMAARRKLNLPNVMTILFVGSFYRHHGLALLSDSAYAVRNSIPDVRFILVGDGLMRNEIESMVADKGLGDIFTFTGERPHSEIPLWISAADVCVCILISDYSGYYGFSIVKLYEYMASGRPVIAASNMKEIAEFIETHNIGLVESLNKDKERNIRGFSDKLIKLLQDEELRERLGQNGRRLALDKFNWDRAAADVEKVLADIMKC